MTSIDSASWKNHMAATNFISWNRLDELLNTYVCTVDHSPPLKLSIHLDYNTGYSWKWVDSWGEPVYREALFEDAVTNLRQAGSAVLRDVTKDTPILNVVNGAVRLPSPQGGYLTLKFFELTQVTNLRSN